MTPQEWIALGTVALAVGTLGLMLVAWAQLSQLREQAKRSDRAHVIVTAEADRDTHALNFVVSNVGRTYATDVAIKWDEPIESVSTHTSDFDDPALWNPPFMSPGEAFRTVLDMSHERAGTDLPMRFTAHVSWSSPTTDEDTILKQDYIVDFQRFFAQREWRNAETSQDKLSRSLDGLASSIRNLAQSHTQPSSASIEEVLGLGALQEPTGEQDK